MFIKCSRYSYCSTTHHQCLSPSLPHSCHRWSQAYTHTNTAPHTSTSHTCIQCHTHTVRMYIIHKVYKIQLLPTCLRVIVPCYVFATYFLKPYLCPILSTARKSLVTSLAHSNAVCVVSRHPPTTTSPCEAMSG